MFVLALSRWFSSLRSRQKDVKQGAMNLALLKESEADECSEKKLEISPLNATDYTVLSLLHSLRASEVVEPFDLTNSTPGSDQINSDDDNDADEFLSVCGTSYGSVHELEQRTSDEESLLTFAKQDLPTVEKCTVSGNMRKSNESLNTNNMKEEFSSKMTNFTSIVDATEQNDGAILLHECTDVLDENEYRLKDAVPSLPQLLRLPTIDLSNNDDESLVTNSILGSLRTESVLESSGTSKSWLPFPVELLSTLLFSHSYPFLTAESIQEFHNSYFRANVPLHINCLGGSTSDNRVAQKNFCIGMDDTISLSSPLKNELLNSHGVESSSDITNSKFEIEDKLRSWIPEVRSGSLDHGLNFVPSISHGESSVNTGGIRPNLTSESLFYDGESTVHLNSESAASDFEPHFSIYQNIGNTEYRVISEFNEKLCDAKAPNLIAEDNDLLSCYTTLIGNRNDGKTPSIILSR